LSRKEEVERLEEEGEDGMVHSLLSGLPDISDEDPSFVKEQPLDEIIDSKADNLYAALSDGEVGESKQNTIPDNHELPEEKDAKQEPMSPEISSTLPDNLSNITTEKAFNFQTPADLLGDEPISTVSVTDDLNQSNLLPESSRNPATTKEDFEDESKPPLTSSYPRRPKVSLTSLLTKADLLSEWYPPTHSSIALSSIMGPQSVIFTWSELPADMPDDDEAERMVDKPELIVRPYIEAVPKGQDTRLGEKHRKFQKLRTSTLLGVEKRTVVAGVVLVIGVAVAVYGVHTRAPALFQNGDVHRHGRNWRRFGWWVGGVLTRGL
jgi:hypothetical protein